MSTLINLVESLQAGLTHPHVSLQIDAIEKLNDSIKSLPIETLALNEVSHVIDFYVSRLVISDPGIVNCLLQGIFWFADQCLVDSHCAVKICRDGFFSNLQVQALRKEERRIAFRVLLILLSNETTRKGLVTLEQDFIQGFITSIKGENDPECLVSVFSMHPIILNYFDAAFIAEDYFECIAAYFPVNYTYPPDSDVTIKRVDLADRLHLCLWSTRIVDGGLLLPLLLEKIGSHRTEAREDALSLLADCLAGTLNAADATQNENLVKVQGQTLPMVHVTVYLFTICTMIRQLTEELDIVSDAENIRQLLCIVTGLARMYKDKAEEADFVETFLSCVWQEKRADAEKILKGLKDLNNRHGGWFAVAQTTSIPGAPQELVADCLLVAVLASPRLMLPRLVRRLVAVPLLWRKVNPLPNDECFYRAKFEQLVAWTPHISFFDRVLSRLAQKERLTPKLFQLNERHIRALVFNLSHTLKRSCCDLKLCSAGDGGDKSQHRMAENVSFSLLCRLISMLNEDYVEPDGEGEDTKAFLAFCSHVFDHMASDVRNGAYEQAMRHDQKVLLASLVSRSSLVGGDLLLVLFKMVQELFKVSVEILQRAACTNISILKNLFTSLFGCCSDADGSFPAPRLVSAILYIAGSLRKNASEEGILSMLSSILLNHAVDVVQLTERLILELRDEESKSCLVNLISALRLLTSCLSKEQQMHHFATFRNVTEKAKLSNPYVACLVNCAILSAARPSAVDTSISQTTAITLGPIVDLLSDYVAHLCESRPTSTFLWKLMVNELGICAATLGNKFANDETAIDGLTKMLDLLLKSKETEAASRFLVLMLRALVVTQAPNTLPQRQFLWDRLLGILLSPTSSYVEVQSACLRDNLSLLVPLQSVEEIAYETRETPGEEELLSYLDEEVTHCLVNPLAVQKCFCLIGRPLGEAWQQLRTGKDFSNKQTVLEENFLYGYLKLVSLLPTNIIGNYAAETLEAAIQAVVGEDRHVETRALGLRTVARLLAACHSASLLASDVAADDFLEKVTRLHLAFADVDVSSASVSSLRFSLARCLRFLVDLPPTVTARHCRSVRRLLEGLLDDDCQSVRLEAARASNEWCLRI